MELELLKEVAAAFGIENRTIIYDECTIGHINSTFFVNYREDPDTHHYVFQKVNTNIFKKPDELMFNIFNVTEHIYKKTEAEGLDPKRSTLRFMKTTDGKMGYIDRNGGYWRVYRYVGNAHTLDKADSTELFAKSGEAFGKFQRQLSDFDASILHESIPNFHNTVSRLNDFKVALEKDVCGRAASIPDDIKFVLDRADKCSYFVDGIASGKFPLRVTHNDTKLNNMLIDDDTNEAICIIDLDTVMPGSALYDFGDSIRFGASSALEDETDLSKVYVRLDMFEAYTQGFLRGVDGSLTENEIRAFPMGAYVITFETGIRFLTDYLNGDTYFRIHREGHNLDRARNQFKLVASMEEQMDELNKIVDKYAK